MWRVRAYGDFWSYCLVAEGAVDIAAEPEVKLWDIAPLDILIREAGGTFTGIDGHPGPHGGSALATNGLLHDQVVEPPEHGVTYIYRIAVSYSGVRYGYCFPTEAADMTTLARARSACSATSARPPISAWR